MRLLKFLITEISEQTKKKFISKFSSQTDDSIETISGYVDDFERFQNDLPADQRDLIRYSYEELKTVIDSKRKSKSNKEYYKDALNFFKKKGAEEKSRGGSDIPQTELKQAIKKFMEIKSELPPQRQDIKKYEWLNLDELIRKNYQKLLVKKLKAKYKESNPILNDTQILHYISEYIENFDQIPITQKNADEMSFSEMEHLLDGLQSGEGFEQRKQDVSDIPLSYDENNLKIFAPTVKDQCIRLGNGRSWCTSQPGGRNMYYSYRLGNRRTLYYVIDEDLPYSDVNFACVILVDPDGDMSLADGTNSGRYSGHQNIPWSEIENKLPKLKGLRHIFVPKPLTQEELNLIKKVDRVHPGDNPTEFFGNDESLVEMYLEYNSPQLNDKQYENISDKLKKKYIGLGHDLTAGQVENSPPDVFRYYMSRKIDELKGKSLRNLTGGDLALLNSPLLKKLKQELKSKFADDLQNSSSGSQDSVTLIFPGRNEQANFISLYGLQSIIPSLNTNLKSLVIQNTESGIYIDIPREIVQFKKLTSFRFVNCIREVPDFICEMPSLSFASFIDNKELTKLPDCIIKIPTINFLNVEGCDNLKLPEGIEEVASTDEDSGNNDMWFFH